MTLLTLPRMCYTGNQYWHLFKIAWTSPIVCSTTDLPLQWCVASSVGFSEDCCYQFEGRTRQTKSDIAIYGELNRSIISKTVDQIPSRDTMWLNQTICMQLHQTNECEELGELLLWRWMCKVSMLICCHLSNAIPEKWVIRGPAQATYRSVVLKQGKMNQQCVAAWIEGERENGTNQCR